MRPLSDDYKYETRRLTAMTLRHEQDSAQRSNLRYKYVAG